MIKQKSQSHNMHLLKVLFWALLISLILFLLLYRLNNFPSLWWDEGWSLSAGRNWIEHGHLGNYLDGQPVPPRIPLRFPVAVPAAISMRIFGIGVWQGRLPNVIFTILALAFYVYIISKMYDRRTGFATLFLVLCLSPYNFQPIIMGRQVMAEMPMMFYLLGGYVMVWLALTRSKAWGVGAILFFGIAIHAKLQMPPFWLVSMVIAFWVSVNHRHRRSMTILAGVAVGSIVVSILVLLAQNMIMPGSFADPALIKILFNTSVIVLDWSIRWKALYIVILFSLPELLGFIWAGRPILNSLFNRGEAKHALAEPDMVYRSILRAAIWGLGVSWLIWYTTMSMFWMRYLFPAFFIGFIFVSAYVSELTNRFDIRLIFQRTSALLFRREFNRNSFQAAAIILTFSIALGVAIGTIRFWMAPSKWDPVLASTYLNNNIPSGARVETYESELFFLAPELIYHFPSDLVSMQLFRRANLDPQYPVDYDPLKANPDFLVVGPFAQSLGVYDDKLIQGWFQLEADVGGYQIYHIRSTPMVPGG